MYVVVVAEGRRRLALAHTTGSSILYPLSSPISLLTPSSLFHFIFQALDQNRRKDVVQQTQTARFVINNLYVLSGRTHAYLSSVVHCAGAPQDLL